MHRYAEAKLTTAMRSGARLPDMTRPSRSHEALAGAALVFVSLAVLSWLSNRNGLYFDDEIFTIQLLEGKPSLRSVIVAAKFL